MAQRYFLSLRCLINDHEWRAAGRSDYNGDGIADILLRSETTGEWQVFIMSGKEVSQKSTLTMTDNLNWSIAGNGDFDGDGITDILIRNDQFGSWMLYTMNKSQIKNSLNVALTEDLSWLVPSS